MSISEFANLYLPVWDFVLGRDVPASKRAGYFATTAYFLLFSAAGHGRERSPRAPPLRPQFSSPS